MHSYDDLLENVLPAAALVRFEQERSEMAEKLVSSADAAIAAIEAENEQFVRDFQKSTNGTYRNNKSRDYRDYYQKRVIVHVWNSSTALVEFAPDQPLRRISRNHLTID